MSTVVQGSVVQGSAPGGGVPTGRVVQATVVPPGQPQANAGSCGPAPAGAQYGGQPQQMAMGQPVGQPVVIQGTAVGAGGVPGVYGNPGYGGGYGAGYPPGGEGRPASDPLCFAVLACFCCCWCIGICAIIKSQEVGLANSRGDFMLAHQKRKEAMMWIYVTIGAGIVINIAATLYAQTQES